MDNGISMLMLDLLLFRYRNELLVISAYAGALLAIRKKYYRVVLPLFQAVRYEISIDRS